MPVILAALAGFVVVLAILSLQMSVGRDPAVKSAAAPAPRRILERRVVVRRVVITDAPASPRAPARASAPAQASPSTPPPAPVQVVQAPPPPAPVTRTS
jgi:hypothetical protein